MSVMEFVTAFARENVGGARVRPYGVEVADLAIDFDAPRAIVATRVIATCLRCDEDAIWSLAVRDRILLLLALSELSLADPVEAHLKCRCGEVAVIELGTEELARFATGRHRTELVVRAGDATATLRLPTGRDQLGWAALDSGDVARAALSQLVIAGEQPLSDALVAAADALLAEVDPLIELSLESTCPGCAAPLARAVDLERIALTRLRNARRVLLEQVHALAATYHWSEAAIAELPAWRRAEYAALAATTVR
jgi:hypothetical protein